MATAALEAKMIHHITAMREEILFKVFLDIQNAYDTSDWDRCLNIITAYGVVRRTLQLLWKYWNQLVMVNGTII